MIKLLALLFLVASSYFITIAVVKYYKHTNTTTAKATVDTFLRECVTPAQMPEIFPVFIGIDCNGLAHANIIEEIFKDLKKVFINVIFDHYVRYPNRIIYYFHVGAPLVEMENNQLIGYATSICDSIVHQFLHQVNPAYGYIPYLVTVAYRPGELAVCISTNRTGLNENYQYMYYQHSKQQFKQLNNDLMSEDWEDK
ncbi:hypothetical protein SAMN02745247_02344 [Butyrivibrio hungatei DSM 14810]|uniref:Uncharacterized protein n=1 Tax=Butyrivibrio hungatei DSM 14810 TaxID=1121132 RepID=A0A1M7SSB7_9FIRM|nr:hypothetical protein [Butyrivibrio hungatei]SHN61311.1 hypothetical protein SAMN02745247_02344 [Butyrivibrio hungatei DSM 14810]